LNVDIKEKKSDKRVVTVSLNLHEPETDTTDTNPLNAKSITERNNQKTTLISPSKHRSDNSYGGRLNTYTSANVTPPKNKKVILKKKESYINEKSLALMRKVDSIVEKTMLNYGKMKK